MRMKRNVFFLFFVICSLVANAQTDEEDKIKWVDNTPDSIAKARTARPVSGSSRKGDNPVLFLIGNSTMRTGTLGNGNNGQWGWGYYAREYFDEEKITVENHALGGMSTRTFYNQLWKEAISGVRQGDWVIIEIGHNDGGPLDEGRARNTLQGIGNDSVVVTIKETGVVETVYSYGGYLRKYIADVKSKGATPILMSLTPRNEWKDGKIVRKTRSDWAKQVAEQEHVPYVDLCAITSAKYEKFGPEKVNYMFYIDKIHTSAFGARVNCESAVEGIRACQGLELANYLKPVEPDTITGNTRKKGRSVVFLIGDSTVKNKDNDDNGMWGWGSLFGQLFNEKKVSVENHAKAGRSSRTFLDEGRWDKVYNALQPGDYVIMQFGHNDGGDINTGKARASLKGNTDESKVFLMEKDKKYQVIYSFGWYLRKFINDCKEKGATPIVLSHTPRNKWNADSTVVERCNTTYGLWAKEAAEQTGAYFIDLNEISAKKIEAIGKDGVSQLFKNDHTHTSKQGAKMNALSVAEGLKKSNCDLRKALKRKLKL